MKTGNTKSIAGDILHKPQIDSHLIFNSLDFIYNTVLGVSQKAAHAVLLISELLQYSARPDEADGKVTLAEEVKHAEHIIELNQIRFNSRLFIETEMDIIPDAHLRIPRLLICTLVENVFKHGLLNRPDYPAKVELYLMDDTLHFRNSNLKRPEILQTASTKLGLQTLRDLLEQFYPDRHHLEIINTEDHFELILKIAL